jgi:hypothetical protein
MHTPRSLAFGLLLALAGCSSPPPVADGGARDAARDDGSAIDVGDGVVDAGSDAGALDAGGDVGTPIDVGTDAFGPDASTDVCDPVTSAGCAASERCVWVALSPATGELRCVPDGTLARGAACTAPSPGPSGFDDCQRGLTCVDGACATTCALGAAGCAASEACVEHLGLFRPGTFGACTSSCDPVTQQRPDGSRCPAGQGCYATFDAAGATLACAAAGTIAIGAVVPGTPTSNACVPGATPARGPSGAIVCTPFCRPVATSSAAPAGAAGMSPHACGDVGVPAPPNECIYAWVQSGTPVRDPRLDMLGTCFDRTGRMIDTNGDGTPDAPWPSCTELAPTDTDGNGIPQNIEYGCGPQP